MINKNLFNKRKPYIQRLFFLFFFIFIIIVILIYFFLIHKNYFFSIPQNLNVFYVIPEDKESETIDNQEKKILHLTYTNKDNITLTNDSNLAYSIQLFTSDDYKFINNYRSKLININDSIFLSEDLYVVILNYELISEYLLLFKNFSTRKNALEYCEKYSYYLEKCIIVNVKNLD